MIAGGNIIEVSIASESRGEYRILIAVGILHVDAEDTVLAGTRRTLINYCAEVFENNGQPIGMLVMLNVGFSASQTIDDRWKGCNSLCR